MNETNNLPQHIAIIMDGNRRWAKQNNLDIRLGHKKGAETLENMVRYCNKIGIKYLTVYAFSTENWKRSKEEVDFLMKLFEDMFHKYILESKENNMKINVIGDKTVFSKKMQNLIEKSEEITKDCTGLTLNIALNYGGRDEIVRCTKKIIKEGINPEELDEKVFSNYLDTKNIPDVDLMIRTGGEYRLSNFLLWQLSYSELYFSPTLFPEFSQKELKEIIDSFKKRDRRFGGVKA